MDASSAMLQRLVFIGLAGCVLAARPTWAQDGGEPIVIGHRYAVESAELNETRPVWVHTPDGYEQSTDAYPVIYLLDGPDHFHYTSGAVEFLARNNRASRMIVVGIPNTDRTRDLTPATRDTSAQWSGAGGADNFLRFLIDELRPWVEARYRTVPYRILIGHSFGGLFATHVLWSEPESFNAYIAISPSLWWDDERWLGQAEELLATRAELPVSMYVTMGNEGGVELAGALALTRLFETRAPALFEWKWKHMDAEDHNSVPFRSTYDGIEWLFRGWQMPDLVQLLSEQGAAGLARVDEHFARMSTRLGFAVRPPERTINGLGYRLLREQLVDDAIAVFEHNVRDYPESANVYDSLGDAYDAACRWEEAQASYAQAYRMGTSTSHRSTEAFKANLERITEKIDAGSVCPTG